MKFDKWIYLYRHRHHQYISITPKSSLVSPGSKLFPLQSSSSHSSTTTMSFAFARFSHKFTFVYFILFNMFLRANGVVICFNSSFHFFTKQYSSIQIYYNFFICSLIGGHLNCLQFWAIMNKVSTKIREQFLCKHTLWFLGGRSQARLLVLW